MQPAVHHALCPDPSAEPVHRNAGGDRDRESAADIRELIRYSTPGKIAAFIAEPIQGVGGVTRGAPNYFREAYAIAREHGGLCIADEVQTGFGRTGEHYWGFQNYGVDPDIVTMAKGIGNGVPLGRGHHPAGDRGGTDPADPLQHLRRKSGVHGGRAGRARRHR